MWPSWVFIAFNFWNNNNTGNQWNSFWLSLQSKSMNIQVWTTRVCDRLKKLHGTLPRGCIAWQYNVPRVGFEPTKQQHRILSSTPLTTRKPWHCNEFQRDTSEVQVRDASPSSSSSSPRRGGMYNQIYNQNHGIAMANANHNTLLLPFESKQQCTPFGSQQWSKPERPNVKRTNTAYTEHTMFEPIFWVQDRWIFGWLINTTEIGYNSWQRHHSVALLLPLWRQLRQQYNVNLFDCKTFPSFQGKKTKGAGMPIHWKVKKKPTWIF